MSVALLKDFLSRIYDVVPQTFTTALYLPVGTLRCVLSTTTTGGCSNDPPLHSKYLDSLYSPYKSLPYFVVASILM